MNSKALVKKNQTEIFDTRNVVRKLEELMTKVTDADCTPTTVNAACNCADRITDILRLHLDVERLKARMNPRSNNEA